ncbi:thimet oligopeptidase, partial [Trypanosoma cruzi]
WAIGMPLPGGELKTVGGHAQWQDTPHVRGTRGCQQLRGEAPQGARLSGSQVAAQRNQTHAQKEKKSRPPPTQLPANKKTLATNRTRMPALPWPRTATPIHSATVI